MKQHRIPTLAAVALAAMLATSCFGEADVNKPSGSTEIPAQVLNPTVKNMPGSAVIYYDLPDDQNLKYVRASYDVDGTVKTVNASFYTDSLIVDGFSAAGEFDVELYSVSYGETVSEPVTVKVNPTTPPYKAVRASLVPDQAFGGLKVNFDNPEKAKLGVGVLMKQNDGSWTELYMHYTESKNGLFYVRGLDAVSTDFGLFVRDRWGHISDTLRINLTPLYEEQCNKALFKNAALPTDTYTCHFWGSAGSATQRNNIIYLWDGVTDADPTFQTPTQSGHPQWFTIDLGAVYKLSRFVMVSRYYKTVKTQIFKQGHPKEFEIWGSLEPNPNGSYDDTWTFFDHYESVKPSGGGVNDPLTAEDEEMAKNGENFLISDTMPPVRYVRFKTLRTWGGTKYMHLHELTFFGQKMSDI